jgi:hypothetical protein
MNFLWGKKTKAKLFEQNSHTFFEQNWRHLFEQNLLIFVEQNWRAFLNKIEGPFSNTTVGPFSNKTEEPFSNKIEGPLSTLMRECFYHTCVAGFKKLGRRQNLTLCQSASSSQQVNTGFASWSFVATAL